MRIDLNPCSMPELERSRGASGTTTTGDTIDRVSRQSEDFAELATGSDAVKTLKTKLDNLPEIRQRRVDNLREALANGTYSISPGCIADGILAEMAGARG